jgi:hypothetical protein
MSPLEFERLYPVAENARRAYVEASTECTCRRDLNDPDRKRTCQRHGVKPWLRLSWPCGDRLPTE